MHWNRTVRRIAFALPLLIAVTLVACDSDDAKDEPTATATAAATSEATAEPTSAATAVTAPSVTVTDAWARATPGNPDENSAVYMTITNDGAVGDRLVGADIDDDLATAVELHETAMEDGQMRMRQVVEGWEVPADGGVLELAQRANHVMLIGLSRQLVEGETVGLTLHFERSGDIRVDAPVRQGMPMDAGMSN